jgi:hypothetical protein
VEQDGFRKKHPFDTLIEGVGLNRMTDNFERASIDDAFTVSDEGIDASLSRIVAYGSFPNPE